MRHVRITNTRPDLVKSACYLACFVENPGISHKTALERVLRYLSSSTDKGIKYQSPTNGGGGTRTTALLLQTLTSVAIQPRTRAHLDTFAFWNANMRTMSSTGFSRKQTAVSRSTTEAELCAAGHGATEGIWERLLSTELKMIQPCRLTIPITIQTDSQSAKALAEGSDYTGGLRHVAVQFRS